MNIRILNYTPAPYGEYQIGLGLVSIDDRCHVAIKLVKAKAGALYVSWAATKIGEQWTPCFQLADKTADKALRDKILAALQPFLMAAQSQAPAQPHQAQQQPHHTHSQQWGDPNRTQTPPDDGIPF